MPLTQLGADAWQLEPGGVSALLAKIKARGIPLVEFAGVKPYRGVVTGCNEAFIIDAATRDRLISADPECATIIKPFLRGQDVDRWAADWVGSWMLFTRRGISIEKYPSVRRHLERYREQLEPRPKDWVGGEWPGRKPGTYAWYEIQDPIEYWEQFERPKIVYQEIQFHPCYALDSGSLFGNNKTFFVASADLYLLAVLNSPLAWWHNWRYLPHMKDEALSPVGFLMECLPVAKPADSVRARVEAAVGRLVQITGMLHSTRRRLLDWLRVEYAVEKPSLKLQSPLGLDCDGFVAEVKKARGKKKILSAAALAGLREEYARSIEPARVLAAEAVRLEHKVSDLVNVAYGLTPEEIALMWATAPPRMPIAGPAQARAAVRVILDEGGAI